MTTLSSNPPVIIGEAVAGESSSIRKQLEATISNHNKSTLDIGELLSKVRHGGYYQGWGFNTFGEYVETLDIKARKAHYLLRIVDTMAAINVERTQYEPLGIAKLREISSLDPNAAWVNPETLAVTPMKEFIVGFVEKGADMTLEEIKTHVRTLKGLTGENDITWLNICLKRTALDQTVRPALELAKAHIGTVGKDDEGVAKDASDGAALEAISVEFINNPANNVLPEGTV